MQNVANTPPPEQLSINGTAYAADTDFLTWSEIALRTQEELYDRPKNDAEMLHNWQTFADIQRLAFGRVLPEPHLDVFRAMLEFAKGYPIADNDRDCNDATSTGAKTYSLRHDMNLIVLAIRNQSGIDLTYHRKAAFHWWLFLLEFQSLTSEHRIVEIMQLRAYDGEDKEMLRRRDRVALPKEYTKSDQAFLDSLEEMFPNT